MSSHARILVAAAFVAMACQGDDDHGIVEVELHGPADAFAGTDRITVQVDYLECLTAFYEDNPDETQAGGSGVFDEWKGRLCDVGISMAIDCDVALIEQADSSRLTIAYDVDGDLAGRRLPVGPLPTAATAGCSSSTPAEIRLASTSAVVGDAMGSAIWHSDTFSSNRAIVDQGAPILVDVVAN
jgi:hypothetical protein